MCMRSLFSRLCSAPTAPILPLCFKILQSLKRLLRKKKTMLNEVEKVTLQFDAIVGKGAKFYTVDSSNFFKRLALLKLTLQY